MLLRNDELYEINYLALDTAQRERLVRRVIREAKEARAAEISASLRRAGQALTRLARFGAGVTVRAGRPMGAAMLRMWKSYRQRQRLRATAARLYAMDDRALKDIGLRRGEIEFILSGQEDPTRRPRGGGQPEEKSVRPRWPGRPEQRAA